MTEKMKVYETHLSLGHISGWTEEVSGFKVGAQCRRHWMLLRKARMGM